MSLRCTSEWAGGWSCSSEQRPIECALCHPDRSVIFLVETMETWWGRRFDRGSLQSLYGPDLTVNVLAGTLARGKPHEQAVALGLVAQGKARLPLNDLVEQLANEIPLLRYYAKMAAERLAGVELPLDMTVTGAQIVRDARRPLEGTRQSH